jgi:hydroxyacylglutathione hydrolase
MPALTLTAVPAFKDNYIWLLTDSSRRGVVVDPGHAAPVNALVDAQNLKLEAVLITHHHADHMGGAAELATRHRCPVFGPVREAGDVVDVPLAEGMAAEVPAMGLRFGVLDIPGHTAGHIAFEGYGILFCGDTLFSAGCGRLFEGTAAEMCSSLAKLAALPDETRMCCGHEYTLANLRFAAMLEPDNRAITDYATACEAKRARGEATLPSTLATERQVNPFLRCGQPLVRKAAEHHVGKRLDDAVEVFTAIREWKDGFV